MLFTPDPAEYNTKLTLQINNTTLPTNKEPKILGLSLDPKLTYSKHIQNTTLKAKQTMHIMKALTTTHWGKSKETLNITYKAITRPILEYASTIWSPIISNTNMNKLQTLQNFALRTITGCSVSHTNTHHQHTETKILPIDTHMKLHGSQLRQQAQDPEHTLHQLTTQEPPTRLKKQTIFHNNNYTTNIYTPPDTTTQETIRANTAQIHTQIVSNHMQAIPHNKILNTTAPEKAKPNEHTQHRTVPYATQNTKHLFNCPRLPTDLGPEALWDNPGGGGRRGCWPAGRTSWGGVWSGDSGGMGHCRSFPGSTTTTTQQLMIDVKCRIFQDIISDASREFTINTSRIAIYETNDNT